jgi:hypothetical protein
MSKELRKFGFSLGLGLNIAGYLMFYRHREYFIWFSGIGSIAVILAVLWPAMLSPVKKILEQFIFIIGLLASAVTFLVVFYLVFTPIGILLKLFGKDLLNQKIEKDSNSYWIKRRGNGALRDSYERMG